MLDVRQHHLLFFSVLNAFLIMFTEIYSPKNITSNVGRELTSFVVGMVPRLLSQMFST